MTPPFPTPDTNTDRKVTLALGTFAWSVEVRYEHSH